MKNFLLLLGVILFWASCSNNTNSLTTQSSTNPTLKEAYNHALAALQSPQEALNTPYQMAWYFMLTLIWPASDVGRGIPDTNAVPGPNQIAVVSTWKNSTEVYLPEGATPEPWDSVPVETQKGTQEILTQDKPLQINQNSSEIVGVTNRLLDTHGKPIYYNVRMNEPTFNSIVENKLYNTEGVLKFYQTAVSKGSGFVVPKGSIEIKGSWKRMYPEDDASRYYTRMANIDIPGGEKEEGVLVGLTGLHIISKIVPNWFFTTFEHVDNATATNITQLGVEASPIPPELAELNHHIQSLLKKNNSPWQYYNCMGVESETFYGANGVPSRLGNTQIETQQMSTSSCIGCHAYAGVGMTPIKKKPFLYNPSIGVDSLGNQLGLTGAINPYDIYLANYQYPQIPSPTSLVYMRTDFIWSITMEGQPIQPQNQLNFACIQNWGGPTGANTCFTLKSLDQ